MNKTKVVYLLIFSVLALWIGVSSYLNNSIASSIDDFSSKVLVEKKLQVLSEKWSEKANAENINSFEKFLNTIGVSFAKKEDEGVNSYKMVLNKSHMDSIINYLMGKSIIIKELKIKKNDKYLAEVDLKVVR